MAERVKQLSLPGGTVREGGRFWSVQFGRVAGPHVASRLYENLHCVSPDGVPVRYAIDLTGVHYCGAEMHGSEASARAEAVRYLSDLAGKRAGAHADTLEELGRARAELEALAAPA